MESHDFIIDLKKSSDKHLDHLTLKKKNHQIIMHESMLASEQVLGKDWNSPEEDEAWADL